MIGLSGWIGALEGIGVLNALADEYQRLSAPEAEEVVVVVVAVVEVVVVPEVVVPDVVVALVVVATVVRAVSVICVVAADVAIVDPFLFVAMTATRIVMPTSAAASATCCVKAEAMTEQPDPLESHLSH
jgi:hypothetical protein